MDPIRTSTSASGKLPQNENSSAGARSSSGSQTPALPTPGALEGLDRPAPATEASDTRRSGLPVDVWRNVAGRLEAGDAMALSSTDKTLRAATGGIAVAKAIAASQNVPAAVHAGLSKAAIPDTDAAIRQDILRNMAGKIGQSTEQPVELVFAFLRTIGPLPPAHRADALSALQESLKGLPDQHQQPGRALADHSVALEQIDTLPADERAVRLASHARHVSSTPHLQAREAMLNDVQTKMAALPQQEQRDKVLAELIRGVQGLMANQMRASIGMAEAAQRPIGRSVRELRRD